MKDGSVGLCETKSGHLNNMPPIKKPPDLLILEDQHKLGPRACLKIGSSSRFLDSRRYFSYPSWFSFPFVVDKSLKNRLVVDPMIVCKLMHTISTDVRHTPSQITKFLMVKSRKSNPIFWTKPGRLSHVEPHFDPISKGVATPPRKDADLSNSISDNNVVLNWNSEKWH